MNPKNQSSASGPLAADRRPGFLGLAAKQKRLLWMLFAGIAAASIALGVYLRISSAPQRAQAQFEEAMKLMKPGYYEAAIAGFDRALKTWGGLAEAYVERGNADRALGRDDDALADFEKAADLNPGLYGAFSGMGMIYSARHDFRRAMEAYTKSIEAGPNADAYYDRGQMYESLGEHQKAIEDYDRAIREIPDAPAAYRARGLARRNMGDEAGWQADRDEANRIEHRH